MGFRRAWLVILLLLSACFPESPPTSDAASTGGTRSRPRGAGGSSGANTNATSGGTTDVASAGSTTDSITPEAGAAGAADDSEPTGSCLPARSSLNLPARSSVVSADAQPAEIPIYTADIWSDFNSLCGQCHAAPNNQGGFSVTLGTFPALVTSVVVQSFIESNDALTAMPRNPNTNLGVPYDQRAADDPVVHFANELTQWMAAGSPVDRFLIPNPNFGQTQYLLSPSVGNSLTNIGNCIPQKNFPFAWGKDHHEKMDELDAMFAALEPNPDTTASAVAQIGLPEHLSQTDLSTFDSDELARNGVIAYAPAYPLWSDGSGKLRYVRVPRGQAIQFNKDTQEFVIPPNTRFYKTFLKKVIDERGLTRYRKMETRLIVSRPDEALGSPGALFGTYIWSEDETDATLLTDLQHDLTPFKDRLSTYLTDEPQADAIANQDPPPTNLAYAFQAAGVVRHYAFPGKPRCIQCHMGSVRSDFVLGFTPLQIWRREQGMGGVIEATGPDELTQLDRLIGLGVIQGLKSSADLLPLEDIEGDRKPRNQNELLAQSYMFGNCGHCHNPHGYASFSVPALKDVLRFWPNKDGGIFQFPLPLYSPRITRGADARAVPYITPSLRDMLPYDYNQLGGLYTIKFDPNFLAPDNASILAGGFFEAPWRSLIYRNTQTPFTYADDSAIFPHMPLNTAGYDCRASKILGTWMVSIPARLINPKVSEDYVDLASTQHNAPGNSVVDNLSQPYEEVMPRDGDYYTALAAAAERVTTFQNGAVYQNCAPNDDIVDPLVLAGAALVPKTASTPPDGVPDHPEWVITDLTQTPGPWSPRGEWQKWLVNHDFPSMPSDANAAAALAAEESVVGMVTNGAGVTLDQNILDFIDKPFPLALWKPNAACDLSSQKTAGDAAFAGPNRPRWFDVAKVAPTAPVFSKLPGGVIFDMVCINCHGPNMDSLGRQADTVQQLTGGQSRVANFRTGLFGPTDMPGTNRTLIFGPSATSSVSADDWGARYMAWMALGGTTAVIPSAVLQLISTSDVAGTRRPSALLDTTKLSANMLAAAQAACSALELSNNIALRVETDDQKHLFSVAEGENLFSLIQKNGDYELWQRLCAINNPPPIRGIQVQTGAVVFAPGFVWASALYPANTPVGNQAGQIDSSLLPSNSAPWCILQGLGSAGQQATEAFRNANLINGQPPPYCPDTLVAGNAMDNDAKATWARRGAVNAGFAVFRYIDRVTHNDPDVKPIQYDQCNLLSP